MPNQHHVTNTSLSTKKSARFFLLFLLTVAYLSISVYYQPFIIKKIICKIESEGECDPKVTEQLNQLQGKLLFSPMTDKIIQQTAQDNLLVIHTISRSFPHTLEVDVETETVLLQLKCQDSILSISHRGFVFQTASIKELPLLESSSGLCQQFLDEKILSTEQHRALTQIVEVINKKDEPMLFSITEDNQVVIQLSTDQRILLTQTDFTKQFMTQELIRSQNEIGNNWSELDVRFDKPILRGIKSETSSSSATIKNTTSE